MNVTRSILFHPHRYLIWAGLPSFAVLALMAAFLDALRCADLECFLMIDWMRFVPKFWMQNCPTDWEWDATLNDLLDRHSPVPGYLTVTVGGVEVWASNYPYAYGRPYRPEMEVLPSVATRKRLHAAIAAAERNKFRAEIAKAMARA